VLLTSLILGSLDGIEVILKSFGGGFRRTCLKNLGVGCSCMVQSLECSIKETVSSYGPQKHLKYKIAEVNYTTCNTNSFPKVVSFLKNDLVLVFLVLWLHQYLVVHVRIWEVKAQDDHQKDTE
jgi:hypothetical protein